MSIPNGRVLVSNMLYQGCRVEISKEVLSADLIQINMVNFDIILGMEWL